MESVGAQNGPPQPRRSKAGRLAGRTAVALLAAVVSAGVPGPGLAEEAGPPPAMRAGVLENPTDGSHTSGIGVASGWVCDASEVVVVIDGTLRLRTAYGTPRGDTLEVCGDTDNGFAVLFNWNLLGDGEHSAVAYADETAIGSATFQVTTLGSPFLRGVQALYAIPDFPHEGSSVGLRWVESTQGFRFVAPPGETVSPIASPTPATSDAPSVAEPAPVGALENPHDGGHMSGIGIASGWVCGAKEVVVEIDGATRLKAAYPTERFDTSILCGSAATGFAVLFNWALLGDGLHTAVARADGIEFDRATFEVRTLGAPFVRGLERTLLLEDFPAPGTDLELRWAQAEQAFKISGLLPQSTPILASPTPSASPTVTPTATLSPTPQITPTPLPSATVAPDPAISLTPSPPPTPSPTPAPTPPVPSGCPSGTMPDGGNGYPGQITARLADHQRVVYCAELRRPARRVEFRVDSICGDAGGSNVLLTVTPPALSSSDGRPLLTMVSDSMPAKAIYGALTRPTGYIPAGTYLFDVLGQTPGANCGSTSNVKISWVYSE